MATITETTTKSKSHIKALRTVLIFSSIYLVAEVVGGIVTGSLALLADAGHMLTDVGGLGLALFAIWFGQKNATARHTYGFYRTEILASVANCMVLIGISAYILFEAYQRFKNPPEVQSGTMMIVAVIGLAVNIAGMVILRKSSGESLNMKGAYFEVLSDMLTSIGVIVAGVIMYVTGWWYADPIISSLIGLLILPRTWNLLKEGVNVLMESVPTDVNPAQLREMILAIEGVLSVHDLHIWTITSGTNAMSAHIVTASGTDLLHVVKKAITDNYNIAHTTIQIELEGYEEQQTHL